MPNFKQVSWNILSEGTDCELVSWNIHSQKGLSKSYFLGTFSVRRDWLQASFLEQSDQRDWL